MKQATREPRPGYRFFRRVHILKLIPTALQCGQLEQYGRLRRAIWNALQSILHDIYLKNRDVVDSQGNRAKTYYNHLTMSKLLTLWRNPPNSLLYARAWAELPEDIRCAVAGHAPDLWVEMSAMSREPQRQVINDLHDAYTRMFEYRKNRNLNKLGSNSFEIGVPKQKPSWDLLRFHCANETKLAPDGRALWLASIGFIKAKPERALPDEAQMGGVVCKRSATGKWRAYVAIRLEMPDTPVVTPQPHEVVGVHLGLRSTVTLSTGEKIVAPKWFATGQHRIARLRRVRKRSQPGSRQSELLRQKIARLEERIANQRATWQHQVTAGIIRRCGAVAIETWGIHEMKRDKRVSRSIHDAAWYGFKQKLRYKSDWHSHWFKELAPYYPSTQTCSVCGYVMHGDHTVRLSQVKWTCRKCSTTHDRDDNAALNVRETGVRQIPQIPLGV